MSPLWNLGLFVLIPLALMFWRPGVSRRRERELLSTPTSVYAANFAAGMAAAMATAVPPRPGSHRAEAVEHVPARWDSPVEPRHARRAS